MSNRTGDSFGLFNLDPAAARLGPESITDRDGQLYPCDTLLLPGWVLTPHGVDSDLVPAWCIDGRFVLAADQAGAIHEGYSDIFGESLGFYY